MIVGCASICRCLTAALCEISKHDGSAGEPCYSASRPNWKVEAKIETFEEAFLAHVVLPDGKTVGEHALPAVAAIYKGGQLTPLLPKPGV
jgi:hypothetical protein